MCTLCSCLVVVVSVGMEVLACACLFQSTVKRELEIGSDNSMVDWYNFLQDITCQYFLDHMGPIGGSTANNEPIVVEIDESLFMKLKYQCTPGPRDTAHTKLPSSLRVF